MHNTQQRMANHRKCQLLSSDAPMQI